MATVNYGNPNIAMAAIGGRATAAVSEYVRGRMADYSQVLDSASGQLQQFQERVKSSGFYDIYRKAEAIINKVSAVGQPDAIRYLQRTGEIQNAPQQMVRWVMAQPTLRQLYHDNSIEGYGDRYADMHPGAIGKDHYDYRRATDGMVVKHEDQYQVVNYYEKIVEDDKPLLTPEKVSILRTWDMIDSSLENSPVDPTSEWNDLIL